jgi:DNA-binding transcriptional ArsR family regulator
MEPADAVTALGSLAQAHRLAIYRLLVKAGGEGLPAGDISRELDVVPSSLTFHLTQLTNSGLVTKERKSRYIIYRADFAALDELIGYLLEFCKCDPNCLDNARDKFLGAL